MADTVEKTHAGSGLGRGKAPIKAAGGAAAARRHRQNKKLQNNIEGITKPAIRRLARRGGVKRIEVAVYECTRGVLRNFLTKVVRDACTYVEYSRRKTVTLMDCVLAAKHNGITLYASRIVDTNCGHEKTAVKKITSDEKAHAEAASTPAAPTTSTAS